MLPAAQSLVRILDKNGQTTGTGFLASEGGLVITCAHVIQSVNSGPGDSVDLVFHTTAEMLKAHIESEWWCDPDAEDVAVLRLIGDMPQDLKPMALGNSANVVGRSFSTFGFPAAKPIEGLSGKCEVIGETSERGHRILQIRSNEVTVGFSGAPVWDEQLRAVIGVVTSILTKDKYGKQTEVAFVIPIETYRAACPDLALIPHNPYRGLNYFTEQDADLYFGRDAAAGELLDSLLKRDVVPLIGVSGSGKSSLVRAGLEKELRRNPVPGLVKIRRVLFTPGAEPLLNLVLGLADKLGVEKTAKAFDVLVEKLDKKRIGRTALADELTARSAHEMAGIVRGLAERRGLLIIADQFERLYTECPYEQKRNHFLDTLLACASEMVKLVVVARADFYHLLLANSELEAQLKCGQVNLGHMKEDELRAAIEGPARKHHVSFQPRLVKEIISDVAGRAGDLPLLQFALTELWERSAGNGVFTHAAYDALGWEEFPGMKGALAQRAEMVWSELDEVGRKSVRRIFLRLAVPETLDVQGERPISYTSRRAWQIEWDEATQMVVGKLVESRLLTSGRDPATGQPTIEVAHEALIRAWPRLRRWADTYRSYLHWYSNDLTPYLHRWINNNRDSNYYLPEPMLSDAKQWLSTYQEELVGSAKDFIQESISFYNELAADRKAQHQRELEQAQILANSQRQRSIILAIGFTISLFFIALTLSLNYRSKIYLQNAQAANTQSVANAGTAQAASTLAIMQESTAVAERNISVLARADAERFSLISQAREITARSSELMDWDPALALLLANEAIYSTFETNGIVTPESSVLLYRILTESRFLGVGRMGNGYRGSAFLSPDGSRVAFLKNGNSVELDYLDGKFIALLNPGPSARYVNLWLADNYSFYDLFYISEAQILNADRIYSITFNQNGTRFLTIGCGFYLYIGCFSPTVILWDVHGSLIAVLQGHKMNVNSGAFSPDGNLIVTTSDDGTARLWDIQGNAVAVLQGHTGRVNSGAFSPDGNLIVTTSDDGTARLWDIQGNAVAVLQGHTGRVNSGAFSPDGNLIVTTSDDGTARLWNLEGELINIQRGLGGFPLSSSFSFTRDKMLIYSGSSVLLLDSHGNLIANLLAGNHFIDSATLSKDGNKIFTVSSDGIIFHWDARSTLIRALESTEFGYDSAMYNPDGSRILSFHDEYNEYSSDRVARLWNATSRLIATLPINNGVFTQDGTRIIATNRSGDISIWDNNGRLVAEMGSGDFVISPEGSHIITFTHERDLAPLLWDVNGNLIAKLEGRWLAFTPNNDIYVLTFSEDGIFRLWDLNGKLQKVFQSELGCADSATFNLDGSRFFTTCGSDAPNIWDLSGNLISELSGRGSAFSPERSHILTGSDDDVARLWDANGNLLAILENYGQVDSEMFNKDGNRILTLGENRNAYLWDERGNFLSMLQGSSAMFTPNGKRILTRDVDNNLHLWDYNGNYLATLNGQLEAFDPGRNLIATSTNEGIVNIWDNEGNLLARLDNQPVIRENYVRDVSFRPGNHQVLILSWDGSVRIWNIWKSIEEMAEEAKNRAGRTLTDEECRIYLHVDSCNEWENKIRN